MKPLRATLVLSAAILYIAGSVQGATISVGSHLLEPDTSGQIVTINVTGDDAVQGGDFYFQIADGGPEAPGGANDGPEITSADILGDSSSGPLTVFTFNNTGDAGAGSLLPQFWQSGTTVQSGTVTAAGVVAVLTVDTTGFISGSWDLKMTGTLMGDSQFPGVQTDVANGLITVVPEPGSFALLCTAAIGALLIHSRRKRWVC